ncbi:MAG: L-lactate dehydrogenase [Bacilli bacterium]|nr:L-lactate dehydrogenase [Bacilli bacterium]
MKNKIVIIGCGNVGMSYAYALLNQKTNVEELALIDLNEEKVLGEVMDLNHGLPFSNTKIKIKAGTYADCHDAYIVCICAGANQKPGETRLELLNRNAIIFKDIIKEVIASGFSGIFLIATNPVDVMSYITYKYSNFPSHRVIGTGTSLDTARLRFLIGEKLNLNPQNIHAYVMGEHGDSEFVPWSNAYVGSSPITKFLSMDILEEISLKVKNAAYEIINKKGATYYAIGMVLVRITNAILNNENTILTLSTYNETDDVYIGEPVILNKEGIVRKFPINLIDGEKEKLNLSINVIKKKCQSLDL